MFSFFVIFKLLPYSYKGVINKLPFRNTFMKLNVHNKKHTIHVLNYFRVFNVLFIFFIRSY